MYTILVSRLYNVKRRVNKMIDNKKVGATIALLRNNKNMTQAELGEHMNVSFQAVSKWERGETLPDVSLLPSLADTLGTTIDYLLRSSEPSFAFRGKINVSDMIEGLIHLKKVGELLGKDNMIYRYAIDGINTGMNTDIELAFTDDSIFEVFVAEATIQNLMNGMYLDKIDVMHSFKREHCRNLVLEYMKKYSVI